MAPSAGATGVESFFQLVTGSTGLGRLGVGGRTVRANHPDDLKQCVYEMRFDVASARYAEFGPFVMGMVAEADEIIASLVGN